jgi:hypothetical protein
MLYALLIDTGVLPGMVANIVILGVIVAFIGSMIALVRYKRAVSELMKDKSAEGSALSATPEPPSLSGAAEADFLRPFVLGRIEPAPLKTARAHMRRLASVYAAAGLCCSLVLSMGAMLEAGNYNFTVFCWLLAVNVWPLIITLHLLVGWNWRKRRKIELVYASILLGLGAISQALHFRTGIPQMAVLFTIRNGPATLLVLLFSNRRVRSIGAVVLPLTLAVFAGAFVLVDIATTNRVLSEYLTNLIAGSELKADSLELAIFALGFAVMAVPGWLLMRWLARRYEARRFSDQSLVVDSVWLLFAASHLVMMLSIASPASILTTIGACPIYLAVKTLGFRWLRRFAPAQGTPPGLLVLRVFALQRKAERIFQPVAIVWRYLGGVYLIGGKDLAEATIQPHSFLEYISGKLASRFINDPQNLEERLRDLDASPDPDGRFRISDFFCSSSMWQMAVSRLMGISDVVLADVREFTIKSGGGVKFEIREVLNRFPVERCVFLVDGPATKSSLASVLKEAWETLLPDSPNFGREDRRVLAVDYAGSERQTVCALLGAIFTAAGCGKTDDRLRKRVESTIQVSGC